MKVDMCKEQFLTFHFDSVGYADIAHIPAFPCRANRLQHRFLRTDAFQDRVHAAKAPMNKREKITTFLQREAARRIDCYGNVCHVFSTYESRHTPSDEKPFARGINSVQLVNDGKRWWIASVTWDTERPDNPIPSDYLPATIPPEDLRKN